MANRHHNYHIIISPPLEVRELVLSDGKKEQLIKLLNKHCTAYAFSYEHGSQGSTLTHIDLYCEFAKKQAKEDIKRKFNKFLKDVEYDPDLFDLFICIKSIKTDDPRTMLGYTFKESPLRFHLFNITMDEVDNYIELYQKKCEIAESRDYFKIVKSVGSTLQKLNIAMTNDFIHDSLFERINHHDNCQSEYGNWLVDEIIAMYLRQGVVFELRPNQWKLVRTAFAFTHTTGEDKDHFLNEYLDLTDGKTKPSLIKLK